MLLSTARLQLREFEEDDWQAVQTYQNDPLYLRYTPWTYRTEGDARDFVQMFINWREEHPRYRYQFAVVLPKSGTLIGNGGIRSTHAQPWEAHIGYEFASTHWGHGYATEVARALLDFGFNELHLHRIYAQCVVENTASAHVLEKIGMRLEGHLRENGWMQERWWDTLVYSILASEWRAQQASQSTTV